MLLKRVQLENFISHERSELEFDYGINVIIGPNGAGKTSILDAVSFGLFNVHSRGKKENLINRHADMAKVAVEFSEGGIGYVVEWTIGRKKATNGVLFKVKDGERSIIARGGERVITSEVERILGLDKDLFMNSIYVQQGEIEKLVTESPANRKQIITKLLGIEDLEKAYQNMRDIISEYQRSLDTLTGELKRKPVLENKLKGIKEKLEDLGRSLESESFRRKEVEKELAELKSQIDELNCKREKFKELTSKKAVLETTITSLDKNLKEKEKELKVAEAASEKVESLKETVAKLPAMESYVELLRKLNEKENELKWEYDKLERVKSLTNKLAQNEESYNSYVEKNGILKQKREERKNYEGAEKELIRIENQLRKDSEKRDELSEELSQKLEEYTQILGESVTLENIESILVVKKDKVEKIKEGLEERAAKLEQEIGGIREKIQDLDFKLSKISEAKVCPICGRELTLEHKARLQEEYEKTQRECQEREASLESELKKVKAEEKECEKILDRLATIDSGGIRRIASEVDELNQKIRQTRSEIEELKKKVRRLKEIDDEIDRLEGEIERLEKPYQEYLAAKLELESRPSKDEIEVSLEKLEREKSEISKEVDVLSKKLGYKPERPEEELTDLRRKKEEFDRNLPLAEKRNELQRQLFGLMEELASKKQEYQEIMAKIDALAYDEGLHNKKQNEFDAKMQEKISIEKEVARLNGEIGQLSQEKESCESELRQLSEKEREKALVERFVKILEVIRSAFHKDGLQKLIRAKARPLLEKMTRDFFERFNLEFSDVQIDDDYNISVIGPAGVQSIDQISGGERVALAIALRLAIARVLSEKVETIIMDEPTTHLDEERRKELVNILNSFFREGGRVIPQMIVITHHSEIEDVADTLYHVSKKEGLSTVETEVPT
ncbi:MAG: AAA family ATPase [Candidatus Methanomethyliales bacterium]|nr:AAA family ATPase [Candidatus Methanomethylicales archaeon]